MEPERFARRCGTPPRQGKQSVWTPTAKGGWSQTHLFLGQKPRGKTIYQIEELKPVLHELKCISRNLNQLTMLSHQGVVRTVNLAATADGIGRCYEAINRLYADTDAVIQGGG